MGEPRVQVEVLCVVTPCSVVVAYQNFRGPCCLLLQERVGCGPGLERGW